MPQTQARVPQQQQTWIPQQQAWVPPQPAPVPAWTPPPTVRQSVVNPLMDAIRGEINRAQDIVPGPVQYRPPTLEQRPAPVFAPGAKPHKKAVKALHSEAGIDDLYGSPTQVIDPGIRNRPVLRELAYQQEGTTEIPLIGGGGHAAIPLADTEVSGLTEEEALLNQISRGMPAGVMSMTAALRAVTPTGGIAPAQGYVPVSAPVRMPAAAGIPRQGDQLFSFANIFKE